MSIGFVSVSTTGIVTAVAAGVHTVDLTETSGSSAFGVFNQTGINVSAVELGT